MDQIYPSLQEKFRNEGICPICMTAMGLTPKYCCVNDHVVCHRCKPYYYACPICRSPLDIEILPPEQGGYHMPPAMHCMPQPYPPYPPGTGPSAPFIEQERHYHPPPAPTQDQELKHCGFCFAGCEARFPEHLRSIHESRCQFRPNLENENLPTDLPQDEGELHDCRYRDYGCNVRLVIWRKRIHEDLCIYKDKMSSVDGMIDDLDQLTFREENNECRYDPEEMVKCRYERRGCMVKMPRRRKYMHEEKCNYSKYPCDDDYEEEENDNARECHYVPDDNPDQMVACIWAEYGCQVTPRLCRKSMHEEKCNYRRVHCSYRDYGCNAMLEPSRRFGHEKNCGYA